MNSKADTKNMNQEKEHELKPKLRFPEFRDMEEWKIRPLGKLIDYENGKAHESHITAKGKYIVVNSKFISTEGEVRKYTDNGFCVAKKEDILMVLSDVPNGRAIAKCYLVEVDDLYTVNQRICKIKPNDSIGRFLFYVLNRNSFYLAFDDGVKQTNLCKADVLCCPVFSPSLPEQQKIADCLSSIDDRITAETQKLSTLKVHKKGLMQQLFPAEGETVPDRRFPEFCDAGEWVLKQFSKYIVLYRGSSPRPIQSYLTSDSRGVNWIKIGDTKFAKNFIISQVEEKITSKGAEKSRRVNIGELILANSMSYGKTYQVAIDGYIYDGWFVLRDYEEYFNKQFLLQLLNSEYMQKQYERFSAGGIVQNISSDIVYKTVLPHTSLEEQKKIADCLASVDAVITAQTQKLDTLKTHKKGLMQQLFPSVEDAIE
jgi:type I restriction enzyme S subunit